jgi:PAS domain S-box-containing protein
LIVLEVAIPRLNGIEAAPKLKELLPKTPIILFTLHGSLLKGCDTQQKQRADVILSCTGDAVLITDAAGIIRHLNEPAELLTGWSCQEAVGRSLEEVFQTIDTISRQPVGDPLGTAAVDKKNVPLCSNCVLVQRHGFEVAIEGSAAYTRDRVGNIDGSVFVFNDISAARAKSLELSHLAQHDLLTDLPNRVLLNDRITQAISFAALQQAVGGDVSRFRRI